MKTKAGKRNKRSRPPRIRVPNSERALFLIDQHKFFGVLQRLSLTGGSAILSSGPIVHGTLAKMGMTTVFGKVTAQIEFLQTGADGIPLAQAFRFVAMDETSTQRFEAAAQQMEKAGFSDAVESEGALLDQASQTLGKLRDSIRSLAAAVGSTRRPGPTR